jgi:hypothetical protein
MLLRAGCKLHLQKYVRLPDDATDPPTRLILEPLLERVSALPPITKFTVAAATYRAFSSGEEAEEQAAAAAAAADAKQAAADAKAAGGVAVKKEEPLREGSEGSNTDMRDASGGEDDSGGGVKQEGGGEGGEAATAAPAAPKHDPNAPPLSRPPCMWMLLTPVRPPGAPAPAEGAPRGDIALPIHIDADLPDFLMPAATFEERMAKKWTPGERFRMYFGGKHGQKVGGRGRDGARWVRGMRSGAAAPDGRAGAWGEAAKG